MTLAKVATSIFLALSVLTSCKAPLGLFSQGEAQCVASAVSPGKTVKVEFGLCENGEPMWAMSYKNKPVILPSKLGFELVERNFKDDFELIEAKTSQHDETWEPVWGETKNIRNNYTGLEVILNKMTVRLRVYDYGVGLRYEFPEGEITIKEELTEFKLTGNHIAWWIPGDYDSEEYVTQKTHLSEIKERMPEAKQTYWADKTFSPTGVQTPIQLKTDDGLYINIHEAACTDFSTMSLELEEYTFKTHLTPDAHGLKGQLAAPCHTPWRTIKISDDAREMLSKPLILNLNEPCAIKDVSWIHPIKYIGVWWEMITGAKTWDFSTSLEMTKPHGATTENVVQYIDFAAENNIDEVLVEGWNKGWEHWEDNSLEQVYSFTEPYPDFDIKWLNNYAHNKGVKLMMHNETASAIEDYERQLPEALRLMRKYGYDAVKTGYCGDIRPRGEHHYGQYMNRHYLNVVQQAAENHIMVNAHEASRPTGLSRTWPNLLAQESARGGEYEAFAAKGGNPPEHTVILPFTRLQGGPMDYTPGILELDLAWAGNPGHVHTTIPGQLALYLVLPSPLQMAADLPEHYMKHPQAFQFIKDVALDWDDSRYLEAEPGEYVTVARKAKGSDNWFVGGKTAEERATFVPMNFLDKHRSYTCTIYKDSPQSPYEIQTIEVTSLTRIFVKEARGGGFAMTIIPKQ
ncbi:MAG: glycoside hydrolase family 97 protein [Bacteroidales bacterium]|nr:glycoside hydrolase family 97 protein [Bacteroidales bacterium]